jgi:hypothetical protein
VTRAQQQFKIDEDFYPDKSEYKAKVKERRIEELEEILARAGRCDFIEFHYII